LLGGRSATLRFELYRKSFAGVPREHVRRARGHAKAGQDFRLSGPPKASVGRMDCHQSRHAAGTR
jgi:hypothetical protein